MAAGIINPITGMRLTKTWLAEQIFPYARDFYGKLEEKSGKTFWIDREIIRPANDVEQLNDALSRISDGFLSDYLEYSENDPELDKNLHAKHGYFRIKHGGNLNVIEFLNYTRTFLTAENIFLESWLTPESVNYHKNSIELNGLKAKQIIWCTGHYQKSELPFSYLPFSATRGEMLRIESKKLEKSYLYNKNAFVLNKEKQEFLCGATFSHNVEDTITDVGKKQVLEKINDLIRPEFSILEHYYGIRPTVLDRKPFIGIHPELPNTYIFNGLGAKGVTQAPYFAKEFVNFILENKNLIKEVDIKRYSTRYTSS